MSVATSCTNGNALYEMNTKYDIILLHKLLVQHEITDLGSDTLMAPICPY